MTQAHTEVDVETAARLLGITERTVINYLRSRQLLGVKVGKKWFIKKASIDGLLDGAKQLGTPAGVLPLIESPLSRWQHEQKNGNREWSFLKDKKKHPMNLRCMGHLIALFDLLSRDRDQFLQHPLLIASLIGPSTI